MKIAEGKNVHVRRRKILSKGSAMDSNLVNLHKV